MAYFPTQVVGFEQGPNKSAPQREGCDSLYLPAMDLADIPRIGCFPRLRPRISSSSSSSSSSWLSSDGGCLTLDEDRHNPLRPSNSTLRSPSPSSPSSSAPPPHQSIQAHSFTETNILSSLQTPWNCSGDDNFPARSTLRYLESIGRSPSPEPKPIGETTFRYDSLDPARAEIRLLRVLPQKSAQIECTLFHVPLDEVPCYVAISYAWGDCDDTRSIILGGHEFPITVSLWQAFYRLRSDDSHVIVWADAVCINQMDATERNHQVQSMTKIYASADSVAVWLGPDYDNSHLAIDVILHLARASQRGDIHGCKAIVRSLDWRCHFVALGELFQRSYWNRLWTVQEVYNGRNVDVYCGSSKLPLTLYTQTSLILGDHAHHFEPDFLGHPTSTRQTLQSAFSSGPGLFAATDRSRGLNLWEAISLTYKHKCQDPRDKIYGVLGLLTQEERDQIPVDYNFSKRRVYANAVKHILETTKQLDLICRPVQTCCLSNGMGDDLPTWLPDFSQDNEIGTMCVWDFFNASRRIPAVASVFSAQRKLAMLAIPIDEISARSMSLQPITSPDAAVVTFLHWRALVIERFGFHEPAHQAFCAVIRAEPRLVPSDVTARDWMQEVYGIVDYHQQTLLPGTTTDERISALARDITESEMTPYNRVIDALYYIIPGRRFCVTTAGRFALVAGGAHEGDSIYVPLGCTTPVVLRRYGVEHKLVGEAYVQGYMYGLAVDEVERREKSYENVILV